MNKKLQFIISGDVQNKIVDLRSHTSVFCGNCEFLNPTEEEQQKNYFETSKHFCSQYRENVSHRGCHPRLIKTESCLKDSENMSPEYNRTSC